MNVKPGTMTSSPGPIPSPTRAASKAEVPELTAQALYMSGVCFDRMSGAGIGEGNATRARIQLRECMRRFAGSSWAKKADVYLPNVRGK